MKIVVLSECFLTESHLKRLQSLGEVEVYSSTTTEEEVLKRGQDAQIWIVDPYITPLTNSVLASTSSLKLVALTVTGYEVVDVQFAASRGIKVADIPGFSTNAVAEHTIALLFSVVRNILPADKLMRRTPLEVDTGNREHNIFQGMELKGKTLGVIGLGKIGTRVAQLGVAFGMKVIGYSRSPKTIQGVKQVSLEELLKNADIISLNLRYSAELENMISKNEIKQMKDGVILINTARGKLIDEHALSEGLKSGKIRGAGFDVLTDWSAKNPLLKLSNVVLTPHSGFYTDKSVENMATMVVENIEAFIKGQPIHIVN